MTDVSRDHSIAVVHLIRKTNGLKPFQDFLDSYRQHKDPEPHDLVLIFKNFGSDEDHAFLEILGDQPYIRFDFAGDGGLDLGPYIAVSRALKYDYFCFLNSFSYVQCDNWLTYLIGGLKTERDAGIVGATASWESSSVTDPPFPNPHIRTTGFVIEANLMRKIRFPEVKNKDDARMIESGTKGLSMQVKALGKALYIVDKNGRYWPEDAWPESETYRSGEQAGLLISDNRTKAFEDGDAWTREYLYALAWTGKPSRANPLKRHKLRHRIRRFFEVKRRLF